MASAGQLGVAVRVEQLLQLAVIGNVDLCDPSVAEWVAIEQLGFGLQASVDFGDGARERREQVADRLHTLDHAERRELLQGSSNLWQLDEHDVAKLVGGETGDADGRRGAVG